MAKRIPRYVEMGRQVLQRLEERLVHTEGHAAAPAPTVSEQAGFDHIMPGHTARYCLALADLYALNHDEQVRRRAMSGINALTYMQSPEGLFRTFFYSVKPSEGEDQPAGLVFAASLHRLPRARADAPFEKHKSMKTYLNTRMNWLSCAFAALVLSSTTLVAAPDQKPNILLIIADDLNNWVGPMTGNAQAKTPNLDKLAARGVTFRNAQCPAPLCNPSRAAFMSGMRPSTTGIYHNQQVWMPHIGRGLCINDYLRKFGYTSLGAGKIYHYRNYRAEDWDDVVFYGDDTLPNHPATRRPGPFGYRMFTDDEPQEQFNEKRAESALVDARSVSWCIERLAQPKQPFFMTCGLHRPHTPWDVPKKYFDMNPLDKIQLPEVLTNDLADVPRRGVQFANPEGVHSNILKLGLWRDRVRAYLAAVSYADAQIGRLLEALDKSALPGQHHHGIRWRQRLALGPEGTLGQDGALERSDARAADLGRAGTDEGRHDLRSGRGPDERIPDVVRPSRRAGPQTRRRRGHQAAARQSGHSVESARTLHHVQEQSHAPHGGVAVHPV